MAVQAHPVVALATPRVTVLPHHQDVQDVLPAVQMDVLGRVVADVQILVVQVARVVVLVHAEVAVLQVARVLVDMDVVPVALLLALADATKVVRPHALENVAVLLVVEYVPTYAIVVSVTAVVRGLANPHVKERAFTLAI